MASVRASRSERTVTVTQTVLQVSSVRDQVPGLGPTRALSCARPIRFARRTPNVRLAPTVGMLVQTRSWREPCSACPTTRKVLSCRSDGRILMVATGKKLLLRILSTTGSIVSMVLLSLRVTLRASAPKLIRSSSMAGRFRAPTSVIQETTRRSASCTSTRRLGTVVRHRPNPTTLKLLASAPWTAILASVLPSLAPLTLQRVHQRSRICTHRTRATRSTEATTGL